MSKKTEGIDPAAKPSGTGCMECTATGSWWFHLRRCAECGHIGCCDSSPHQHARAHYHASHHPVIASFEPGEVWFYSFDTDRMMHGPELADPRWHPQEQPVPGPRGRVPEDWQSQLN
ncbi:MAG TPA: UBP-type zinc finger domain-containing protein [Candidatus Acidoferrales bacterium]|nr:UBP-type zinc finger domain-containing protein [Candidatus Acidoferrales bacterium]